MNPPTVPSSTQPAHRGLNLARFLVPVALFCIMSGLVIWRWHMDRLDVHEDSRREAQVVGRQISARINTAVDDLLRPLRRMRRDYAEGRIHPRENFIPLMEAVRAENPALPMIGFANPNNVCRIHVPPDAMVGNEGHLADDPTWAEPLARARHDRQTALGACGPGPVCVAVMPIFVPADGNYNNPPKDEAEVYRGDLVARLQLQPVMENIFDPRTRADFSIALREGTTLLYSSGDPDGGDAAQRREDGAKATVSACDRTWELQLIPTAALQDRYMNARDGNWVLSVGLAGSLIICLAVAYILNQRFHDLHQTDRFHSAMEKLHQISAAIATRLGSDQVLFTLAEAAQVLMDMDRCGVLLINRPGDRLELRAYSGDMPRKTERSFPLSDLALFQQTLRARRPLFLEDVAVLRGKPVNWKIIEQFNARSIILIPLDVQGNLLGFLALSNSNPRHFSGADRRLAPLLGSQASVTLVNSYLYRQRGQALETQQKLVERQARLFEANAAIYRATSLQESLEKITELAPAVLEVDVCVALLLNEKQETIVGAITPPHAQALIGKPFTHSVNSLAVERSRRMMVVEDASNDPGLAEPFVDGLDVGSVLYAPLVAGGSYVGTLMFLRHATGPFSRQQLEFADIFASRAGAAVQNARLLEQTRRDAEVKAMLLRELNHRVKNNLASIVALLQMNEPELSPQARQWLDRAIDRITNMARTHALFTGSLQEVSLTQLVTGMLPSLAMVKPAGVEICIDVDEVADKLDSDRAVSLAIVLYELCYNALVHGMATAQRGTVNINARTESDGQRLVLDVIDCCFHNGLAEPTLETRPANGQIMDMRTGLGLSLVQGLVKRELGGTFSLQRGVHGGTIATVNIPTHDPIESDSN